MSKEVEELKINGIASDVPEEDVAGRKLTGIAYRFIWVVALVMSFWQFTVMFAIPIDPLKMRAIHLAFIMTLGFFLWPATKRSPTNRITLWDIVLVLLNLSVLIYIFVEFNDLIYRAGVRPTQMDVIMGGLAILLTIELVRRATGLTLPILAVGFFLYSIFGGRLPGVLGHPGYSVQRTVSFLFGTDGIYTIPLGVSATYVFLFVLFGAFLHASGAGGAIIDIAKAVAGSARGGPAKVAIIASSLFGTISGVAVANVAVTGSFTIPMMKKIGYPSHFAAAVEAVASTGGQITPPVMGAAAFLMAELLGVSYTTIIIAAIIPTILYYSSVYFMVDFESVKQGLFGLPRNMLPSMRSVLLTRGHLLLPIIVLAYFLVIARVSPIRAGLWSIIAVVGFSFLRKQTIMYPKAIAEAMVKGPQAVVTVASTCAAAGIVMGVMLLTGLGHRFGVMLLEYSGGYLPAALFLAMVVSLVLGMGVPPVAAYAIAGTAVAPGLVQLGVPRLAAHLFVFYFCAISVITPPVALAAYAAAAISGSNMWKVGMTAFRIGIAAYIVPYMFVYGPPLLMQGEPWRIALALFTALVGVACLAGAAQSWLHKPLLWPLRVLLLAASLSLVRTGPTTDLIGFGLIAVFVVLMTLNIGVKKPKAEPQQETS